MKFFKFEINAWDFDKDGGKNYNKSLHVFNLSDKYKETHYFNVEDIKEIIVSSDIGKNTFTVRTRGGSIFYIKNDYLDSLLKLLNIDEKEDKK